MATTLLFEFDWTATDTWVDEKDNVQDYSFWKGMVPDFEKTIDPFETVASKGVLKLTLENSTKRYSPDYASGALYGNLLIGRKARVRATNGVTTWTVWYGKIVDIVPDTGSMGLRRTLIECEDLIGELARQKVAMPLAQNLRANEIVKMAVNYALGAPFATATATFSGQPTAGGYITFDVLKGAHTTSNALTFTFRAAVSAAGDVLIGATLAATLAALVAAVNGELGAGTLYGTGTEHLIEIVASVSGSVVTFRALFPGTIGNGHTIGKSDAAITLSGGTLTGGVDYPAGLMNYQTAFEQFPLVGERWASDQTTALQMIRDAAESDRGVFYIARDSTVTYLERRSLFDSVVSSLTINDHPVELSIGRNADMLINIARGLMRPAAVTGGAGDEVARASTKIRIPPAVGGVSGERTFVMPFRDNAGRPCGARDVILPLVATTDFTVNDKADGTGVDYTSNAVFTFSAFEVRGSEIQITAKNAAGFPLYITMIRVRGTTITYFDLVVIEDSDATSQTAHGKRIHEFNTELSADENFVQSYVGYIIDRYKDDFTDISLVKIVNKDVLGSTNIFSLELFSLLTITDSQSGLTSAKAWLRGYRCTGTGQQFTMEFFTQRADDLVYWNLGVTDYGELNTNTRLAP